METAYNHYRADKPVPKLQFLVYAAILSRNTGNFAEVLKKRW